ncbi:hypothetical protein [Gordonia sp. SL306]|uniref:hypothetical protein n=1 Tax=Gordonia sp. SL306 TaxID=2995145 RepID=UPI00226E40E4|nr:hypothetical protein [Gordonia sp. SL306]WAC55022.1 hypothetical protein OVA31_20670 [Gordonia sp. SL306]
MIDITVTPEGVRDIARLTNALRDGDTPEVLEPLIIAGSAHPGRFLGGAVALLLTVRTPGQDPGLTLHHRAENVIATMEARR